MQIERNLALPASCTFVALFAAGCASTPEPTGFLSDYSRLEKTGQARMGYVSPQLAEYDAFMIDPGSGSEKKPQDACLLKKLH